MSIKTTFANGKNPFLGEETEIAPPAKRTILTTIEGLLRSGSKTSSEVADKLPDMSLSTVRKNLSYLVGKSRIIKKMGDSGRLIYSIKQP